MRDCRILCLIFVFFCFSGAADAAPKEQSLPNGKPFKTLQEQIDENSEAIAIGEASILALQSQTDTLQNELSAVTTNLMTLKATVTGNSSSITGITDDLSDLSVVTSGLATNLADLTSDYRADIVRIDGEIAQMHPSIEYLTAVATELAADLSQATADLNAAIGTNSAGITGLLLDVVNLNSDITLINTSINAMNSTVTTLGIEQDSQAGRLDDIELRLTALGVGEVTATPSTPSTPIEITFETLNSQCTGAQTLTWTLNGVQVASSPGDTSLSCSCTDPVTTTKVNGAVLSSITLTDDGTNTLQFQRSNDLPGFIVLAWSRATLVDDLGNVFNICLYDYNGGDCTKADLCAAEFTGDSVDTIVRF